MVILLSVFNGFEILVKDMYAQNDADIEIYGVGAPTESLREKVLSTEGVLSASFILSGQALATAASRQTAVEVRGADSLYYEVYSVDLRTVQGTIALTRGEINNALMTSDISQLLGIYTVASSRITLHSLDGADIGSLLPMHNARETKLHAGGIIRANQQHKGVIVIPMRAAAEIFDYDNCTLALRTSAKAERVKARLEQRLGSKYTIKTREEKNSLFYQIMNYEKWAIFFVALLVLVIASLSIIGTVIMLIVEKRDEFLPLLAMGANSSFIRGIFVREGLLISGIGGGIGLLIGVVVVLVQQWFGLIALPSDGFVIESYPVRLALSDLVIVFITFVAIALSVSQVAANTMIKRRL